MEFKTTKGKALDQTKPKEKQARFVNTSFSAIRKCTWVKFSHANNFYMDPVSGKFKPKRYFPNSKGNNGWTCVNPHFILDYKIVNSLSTPWVIIRSMGISRFNFPENLENALRVKFDSGFLSHNTKNLEIPLMAITGMKLLVRCNDLDNNLHIVDLKEENCFHYNSTKKRRGTEKDLPF